MILAIDCDLRQSYCVDSAGRACRGPSPAALEPFPDIQAQDTVLFEIASPVSFNRGGQSSAIMHNLAKWAIFNVAQAALLDCKLRRAFQCPDYPGLLVCPSNVWTKGYDLKTRHLIAGCKQPKKDLRECEALLYFYKQDPTPWLPLHEYLARI